MTETTINLTIEDSVAIIALARPEKLNSFNHQMAQELQQALARAEKSDVRAVLLRAEGRGFCAGQDLADYDPAKTKQTGIPDLGRTIEQCYNPIVKAIRLLEKPVVCAVQGVAAGAGANLAFCCDIVLASREAFFIQSFAKVGLVPDCGGSFFLPRLVGFARATALTMLGEKISADQAQQMGLIYKVCEPEKLKDEALALAKQLATQPTRGLALTKRSLNHSLGMTLDQQLAFELESQRAAGKTKDFAEGVSAFFEKRQPQFRGE